MTSIGTSRRPNQPARESSASRRISSTATGPTEPRIPRAISGRLLSTCATCSRNSSDDFRSDTPSNKQHVNHTKEEVVSSTKTRVNKLNTVVIPVGDQQGAVAFYVEKLGLEQRVDIEFGNGYHWIEVAPAGAETTIALAPPPEGKPTGNHETGIGLHTDDIDAYHAELKANGVDVDTEVSRMGDPVPPLFWLRDPEGNSLMVVGNN